MLSDRWRVLIKHTDLKVDVQLLVNLLFYDLCHFLNSNNLLSLSFRFTMQALGFHGNDRFRYCVVTVWLK